MQRTTDMTKGHILKLMLKFAFPLILTNLGQQLYMIVDGAIVGRGVGVKALAAVGAADWTYWLILWTIMGLTYAFSTFVSRYFGEKNYKDVNKTIAMSTLLCVLIGVFVTAIGLVCVNPILNALDTPSDIIGEASIYLNTMLSGIVVVTAYNMASSILRAFGDGRSPLIAMLIAAILNIGLDLVFVMVFNWGVFGAAIASVISQLVSFLYCLYRIKKIDCVKIEKDMWKPDYRILRELVFFAFPLSLQYIVIGLGGVILQSTINLQGSIFVAGFTAVNKLYGLLESTAISLGVAFSTFFSQNYGAGINERVKKGMRIGEKLCIISAIIVMIFVFLTGEYLVQIFIDVSKEGGLDALTVGLKYLFYMNGFLVILYLIHIYRNFFQAIGISFWSVISGSIEFVIRVFMGKVVFAWCGVETLFFIEPAAWIGALLLVIVPYYVLRNKLIK